MFVTLDSSIIVAALRKQEARHEQCRSLLEKVRDAQHIAIQPYIVLVEVIAAVKRRTDSEHLGSRVKELLQNMDTMNFVELEAARADSAADLASKTGLKGMDAIVVQVAEEFHATLITLDEEMIERAKCVVNIKDIDEF